MYLNLEKEKQIDELYELNHIHDSKSNRHYPYEKDLLFNQTSKILWKNSVMNGFMSRLHTITVLFVSQVDLAKNFYNYTVDKYYNDYWG